MCGTPGGFDGPMGPYQKLESSVYLQDPRYGVDLSRCAVLGPCPSVSMDDRWTAGLDL